MKRTGRLTRTTPLKRAGRVKAVNAKRKASEWQRAYGSKQRVAWVAAHPCLVCSAVPSENAHATTGGTGRKANAETIVPLCHAHHAELHQHGARTFQTRYGDRLMGNTLLQWADVTERRWQRAEQLRKESAA